MLLQPSTTGAVLNVQLEGWICALADQERVLFGTSRGTLVDVKGVGKPSGLPER